MTITPAEWIDALTALIVVAEVIPAVWFLLVYPGVVFNGWYEVRVRGVPPMRIRRIAALPALLRSGFVLILCQASVRLYFLAVLGGYRSTLPFGPWTPAGPDLLVEIFYVIYAWGFLWTWYRSEEQQRGEWRT